MIQLSGINIYPIKSISGIQLKKAKIGKKGLFLDRRWMLVDSNGQFITQRKHPQMALIGLKWLENQNKLYIFDRQNRNAPIELNISEPSEKPSILVKIWDDQCRAIKVGDLYDQWFSTILGFSCHLVYMPDATHRPVDPKYALSSDEVSFADGFPYLICNEASLRDLNSRLETAVSMDRFRPNLIFAGNQAWEEDHWTSFSIGKIGFRSLKPCARCVLITVDPLTSKKGIEPLRTLSSFRKKNNKVLFGMNACWDTAGDTDQVLEIQVGDAISAQ